MYGPLCALRTYLRAVWWSHLELREGCRLEDIYIYIYIYILEKIFFFAPGTLVDPPLARTVRGLAGPPAAPSDHWYGGLGVSLGDSKAWKPPKVGVCGWTRCPRNSDLSHVAQDTARSWFPGVGAHCAVFGAFWRLFGPFLGHIVELEGTKGPLVTRKSSRTCSVAVVCLRLAGLNPQ